MALSETILGLVIGSIIGTGGTIIAYWIRNRKSLDISQPTPTSFFPKVPKEQLDKSKRELNTIMLEKELTSGALTRLYEAEATGKITKTERDSLSAKYREQMKILDSKLSEIEAFVEAGELRAVREEMITVFQTKLAQIESRISKVSSKLEEKVDHPPLQVGEQVPDEKPKEKKPIRPREGSEAEKKAKDLRDEVLETLARLEQMDIEGK